MASFLLFVAFLLPIIHRLELVLVSGVGTRIGLVHPLVLAPVLRLLGVVTLWVRGLGAASILVRGGRHELLQHGRLGI